ncbi:hypothetical protein SASPL_105534 [Salvia splendens]|uniref:Uncharacterized protein n=1 Tax=Salvia splendens TaxID=180675 RepID=A0A8X8YLI7_SALSN|nr:uncharacterized protein LOC121768748 [Salvia splendens]KAG6433915.1 hypothetical protein SASPL_105534 [Salvia splendens]
MPQVDLETLVAACSGGGNDRKITCETLADDDAVLDHGKATPPESFWLSKDAEYDWFDRNAFYERKDSTRANSIQFQPTTSNPQRSSVKSKASIIGLPKTQKSAFVDSKRRACKPPNIRLFPKRSGSSAGKPTAEPGSPKVSCMGRVRSKRGRRPRSNSLRKTNDKPAEKKKTGLYSKVMNLFRSKKKASRSGSRRSMENIDEPPRISVSVKAPVCSEPPGLGGITRFASGRRSGSFLAEELNPAVRFG